MTQFSSLYGSYLDEELATDDTAVLFTTARRKSAINKGLNEFARVTKCVRRQSTVTITGGTAEYNLNAAAIIADQDFLEFAPEPVQVLYTDAAGDVTVLVGDDLPRRDVAWLDRYQPDWPVSTVASSVMQLPEVWYDRPQDGARYLGFWPTPSTGSSASAKAIVPYIAAPAPLTADTSEPFTINGSVRTDLRPYHQAAVHYAAHQLEKLRRDDQAGQTQLQRFLAYVTQYLQDRRTKTGGTLTFGKSYFGRRNDARAQDPRT